MGHAKRRVGDSQALGIEADAGAEDQKLRVPGESVRGDAALFVIPAKAGIHLATIATRQNGSRLSPG